MKHTDIITTTLAFALTVLLIVAAFALIPGLIHGALLVFGFKPVFWKVAIVWYAVLFAVRVLKR